VQIMLAFLDTKPFGAAFTGVITLAISYQAGVSDRALLALPLLVVIAYCLAIYRPSR
jgi:hypothetical protein